MNHFVCLPLQFVLCRHERAAATGRVHLLLPEVRQEVQVEGELDISSTLRVWQGPPTLLQTLQLQD